MCCDVYRCCVFLESVVTDMLCCVQTQHSLAQEGLYYTVPEAEVKQLFQKGLSVQFARQVSVNVSVNVSVTVSVHLRTVYIQTVFRETCYCGLS